MRLLPETKITVLLDSDKHRFILVNAGGDSDGRLNVAAPLAVLLGAMAPGDVVKAWTPSAPGAKPMRVELVEVVR